MGAEDLALAGAEVDLLRPLSVYSNPKGGPISSLEACRVTGALKSALDNCLSRIVASAQSRIPGVGDGEVKYNPLLMPIVGMRSLMGDARGGRRIWRHIPSGKRCKACFVPFQGVFSVPFLIMQIRASRKNPNLCTM